MSNELTTEAAVVDALVLGPVTMHNELTAEAAVVGTVENRHLFPVL